MGSRAEATTTETMTIKVYGMPFQHNYVAIHAACKMTGTEFEFVFTNLMDGSNKTPEYLAKFPMHCCPAMEDTDNGLCITETNAIMRYIARKAGHALYPEDLKQAAICDMALDHKLCSLGKDIAYTFIYPKVGFAPAVEAEALAAAVEKRKTDQWAARSLSPTFRCGAMSRSWPSSAPTPRCGSARVFVHGSTLWRALSRTGGTMATGTCGSARSKLCRRASCSRRFQSEASTHVHDLLSPRPSCTARGHVLVNQRMPRVLGSRSSGRRLC